MRHPPRIDLELGLDLKDRDRARRQVQIGKKATVTLDQDEFGARVADGLPIRLAIVVHGVYGLPTSSALDVYQRALIDLLPGTLGSMVMNHMWGQRDTSDDFWTWRRDFRNAVIALAEPHVVATPLFGDRVPCPLCRGVPDGPFRGTRVGFAFERGLQMHLDGDGNARLCDVMRAIDTWGKSRL